MDRNSLIVEKCSRALDDGSVEIKQITDEITRLSARRIVVDGIIEQANVDCKEGKRTICELKNREVKLREAIEPLTARRDNVKMVYLGIAK